MTRQEMITGLAAGRRLIQEEWADGSEINAVDQLVAEGKAQDTPWQWKDNFQCMRRIITAHEGGING